MLKRHHDPSFPSHKTFRRFGDRKALVASLRTFCEQSPDFGDVVGICDSITTTEGTARTSSRAPAQEEFGHVYLLKSGRYYKIGRSNAVGRRERELAIQLPEKAAVK